MAGAAGGLGAHEFMRHCFCEQARARQPRRIIDKFRTQTLTMMLLLLLLFVITAAAAVAAAAV